MSAADPVQKMIAGATRNAARCGDCYVQADLSQSYHTRRLDFTLNVHILPCPVHQPDLAAAFTYPTKPKKTGITIGRARKIAGLPPLPVKKTDPAKKHRRR